MVELSHCLQEAAGAGGKLSAKRGIKAGEVDCLPAACCALLPIQFAFKGVCTGQSHRHIFLGSRKFHGSMLVLNGVRTLEVSLFRINSESLGS